MAKEKEEATGPAERTARAALCRVGEPGDETMGRWLAAFGPEEVWRALRAGRRLPDVSDERWGGLLLRAARADPARDLATAAGCGARLVCPGDAEWPSQLDDLGPARPVALWVRGAPSLRFLALRSVSLVGARACTDYGAHVATELAAALTERGWTVVSGGAYGIDAAAHRGALVTGGPTVAVLACGVDVCYPRRHQQLLARVAGQGLLVAELPPGEHPTRHRFLQRNRVLAALTRGTVVVEAAARSGALVTARHARRLHRQVMGVPGPVCSAQSHGVHQLLRDGACLVTGPDEITELTGAMGELAAQRSGPLLARDLLSEAGARVLEAVPARGAAAALREIAAGACTTEPDALARLHELRALGFVEQAGERWLLSALPGRAAGAHTPGIQG
ncbi:DNA-processing protein DprA [Streptomyces sp. YIM 98790]|uniref:DNA-processing protein DprA n=1 Tax=Streptomyces sp. YIM 98790 TaxID=2689077 RepID=UPI0014076732|nr:DNA-processing protein DprA [Streptomyces sp. YIM 98790]